MAFYQKNTGLFQYRKSTAVRPLNHIRRLPEGENMNRAVKTAALVMGILAVQAVLAVIPVLAQQKFAIVRPDYVLSQYEPYQNAIKQYETFEKSEGDKLQKMADALQKKYEEAQKQAPLMKEEQIQQKSQELERERAQIQKAQEDLLDRQSGRLVKKQEELIQPIFDRFNRVLDRIGQQEGYDFVFNADSESQTILYADKKHDISDKVLETLKKEPAGSSGSSSGVPKAPAKK